MKIITAILVFTMFAAVGTQEASAMSQFKKAFTAKYAAKHKSKEFQAAAKKASCNVCHVKGAKKTVHNEYGKLLNKLIEGNANKRWKAEKAKGKEAGDKELAKIMEELDKAFDKAGEAKPEKGSGPTYAEIIKEGQLPVDPAKAAAAYKAAKKKAGDTEVKSG